MVHPDFVELAAGAADYLHILAERDIPVELAFKLVRDWHAMYIATCYGLGRPSSIWPGVPSFQAEYTHTAPESDAERQE